MFLLIAGFTHGVAIVSPQYMINWRMVGINLNTWSHTFFGWIITVVGMLLTLVGLIILIRKKPVFGDNNWLMVMVGVFSATLAFTWHAHIHMAMVMIPLVLAGFTSGIISRKVLFYWLLITPATWILVGLVLSIIQAILHLEFHNDPLGIAVASSSFIANLVLFLSIALPATSIIKAHNEITD